ncbi:MAG TPA: peptide deformylase, partial [Oxalobacteraceae bacterium]|nr:peptide deformylase [Oxalobacteraceae bacterium]
ETVLINPVLKPLSAEIAEDWEGCLSVPGLRGMVPRWTTLHYEGYDQNGRVISRDVEAFHARVVQHECDHLAGILYPMRIKDFSRFGYVDVLFPGLDADLDE